MQHFFGKVGNERRDVRTGSSKADGIYSHIQTTATRVASRIYWWAEKNRASIEILGGLATHHSKAVVFTINDVDGFLEAFDAEDPRIVGSVRRIYAEFDKINARVPAALARRDRMILMEQRKEERTLAQRDKEQTRILRELQPQEKARIVKLFTTDSFAGTPIELDADGNFEPRAVQYLKQSDLHVTNGHVFIKVHLEPICRRELFDVTDGVWVVSLDSDELLENVELTFGRKAYSLVDPPPA